MKYRATVVDLVPDVSDEQRASECSSEAYADDIKTAEQAAIEGSSVNYNRRVYVQDMDNMTVVKGPYILKAKATEVTR